MAQKKPAPLPLAITMGEPAGIGPEIILKAWQKSQKSGPAFFYIGNRQPLEVLKADVPIIDIDAPDKAAKVFSKGLPVLEISLKNQTQPGILNPANASGVIEAIRLAISLAKDKQVAGIVTAPIHKKALYDAGFKFPGHTEYLAQQAGLRAENVAMMLAVPGLRVVPVTVHIPLSKVAKALSAELIVEKASITHHALKKQFGIAKPKIAVAALNPHAGEEGTMGHEEETIITPAIDALCMAGIKADGPFPADTLFHPAARKKYDAVLCMYHDQALIPLKTIDFDHGVNVTLGLPFIRTSPDHGTALDIAGKNRASPDSLVAAIKLAHQLSLNSNG